MCIDTINNVGIEFMKNKSGIITKYASGVEFLLHSDIEDLNNWNENHHKLFLESIPSILGTDSKICPWCYKYKRSCDIRNNILDRIREILLNI